MVKILHVFNSVDRGGAETVIMNYYKKIDRNQFQFDFVVHTRPYGVYESEIKQLGGDIYYVPKFIGINLIQYLYAWYKILKKTDACIIQGHMPSTACLYLAMAKMLNKITIAHSHTNDLKVNEGKLKHFIRRFMYFMTRRVSDYFFACSTEAGIANFGRNVVSSEKFMIWTNAIDFQRFSFNPIEREKIRAKYNYGDDCFIIGHVGRLTAVKNHDFILKVFDKVHRKRSNVKLILIGTGELRENLEKEVLDLNLEKDVTFTGDVDNVNEYMMGMDAFVLPSIYEGLPTVAVEAQVVGIPCLLSNNISRETKISNGYVKFLSIINENEWVEKINILISEGNQRKNCKLNYDYDINCATKRVSLIYMKMLKNCGV